MSNQQEWDEDLDAMIAAPEHHKILLENSQVRVLDSWIKPGEETPVHTHRWASVLYILGASDFIRYVADGYFIFDSRNSPASIENGTALWSQPLTPHFVKNIGDGEIRVISVELKDS
jgi:quercetin dioxygenase-like cupin family protein